MAVPLCGFFVAFVYPIYLNALYRRELDSFRETKIGYVDEHGTIGDPERDARRASLGVKEGEQGKINWKTEHLEV
jgi:FHS family L-fucose permease-like MFS transporter